MTQWLEAGIIQRHSQWQVWRLMLTVSWEPSRAVARMPTQGPSHGTLSVWTIWGALQDGAGFQGREVEVHVYDLALEAT